MWLLTYKKKTGLNRFVLAFPSGETANEFAAKVWENKKFIMRGEIWVASVPHFKVTKKIILKGIDDPDMDLSLLLENIASPGIDHLIGNLVLKLKS